MLSLSKGVSIGGVLGDRDIVSDIGLWDKNEEPPKAAPQRFAGLLDGAGLVVKAFVVQQGVTGHAQLADHPDNQRIAARGRAIGRTHIAIGDHIELHVG